MLFKRMIINLIHVKAQLGKKLMKNFKIIIKLHTGRSFLTLGIFYIFNTSINVLL